MFWLYLVSTIREVKVYVEGLDVVIQACGPSYARDIARRTEV
jgi:hypothetical protein